MSEFGQSSEKNPAVNVYNLERGNHPLGEIRTLLYSLYRGVSRKSGKAPEIDNAIVAIEESLDGEPARDLLRQYVDDPSMTEYRERMQVVLRRLDAPEETR